MYESYLKTVSLETPIGPMIAIADEEALFLLEFANRKELEREIERMKQKGFSILPGKSAPLAQIEQELWSYFEGSLQKFQTPFITLGSPFQKRVWEELQKIPHGETRSYSDIARAIGQPSACRAVARANGTNQLALMIPCHRVIQANGEIGGYAGGITRKQWLLNHEKLKTINIH